MDVFGQIRVMEAMMAKTKNSITTSLQSLFPTEQDKYSSNFTEMTNPLDLLSQLECAAIAERPSRKNKELSDLADRIPSLVNIGYQVVNSKVLIADFTSITPEIRKGLQTGKYYIENSVQTKGNLLPLIKDSSSKKIVKQITLKRIVNSAGIMVSATVFAVQLKLDSIAKKIDKLTEALEKIQKKQREKDVYNPYFEARDCVLGAINLKGQKQIDKVMEADKYLNTGLINLYMELEEKVIELDVIHSNSPIDTKDIDQALCLIQEDLLLVLRYVGLRLYLLNTIQAVGDIENIVSKFEYQMKQIFLSPSVSCSDIKRIDIVHEYYPYTAENIDAFLEIKRAIPAIKESFLTSADAIHVIGMEDYMYENKKDI